MLQEPEVIAWLETLWQRGFLMPKVNQFYRNVGDSAAWRTEAQTALQAIFPADHAVRRSWDAMLEQAKTHQITVLNFYVHHDQAVGVVEAALTLVRQGRLASLIDGVRLDTVSEVLEQADAFHAEGHLIAAAVLAGGALETHLAHLCVRHKLTPADASISNYNGAIAQARNAGTVTVYGKSDSKAITDWGGIRNDAAHTPTTFSHSAERVKLMVAGIREFLARVP